MSQCRDDFEGTNSNLRLSRRGLMQTAVGTGLGLSLAGSLKVKAEGNSDLRQGQEEPEAGHHVVGLCRSAG